MNNVDSVGEGQGGGRIAGTAPMRKIVELVSLATLGLAVAVLALGGFVALSTESASHKVRVGMTEAEVQKILGGNFACGGSNGSFFSSWTTAYYPKRRLWCPNNDRIGICFRPDTSTFPSMHFQPDCLDDPRFWQWLADNSRVWSVHIEDYGPDQRSVWQRIQDEYEYQKRNLGW